MAGNTFNARLKNKRDTSANWTQSNPVLLNGEIILVDTAEGELRAKIGDGTKTYTQLPFSDEYVRALIDERAPLENGTYIATASSSDGVAYTATVPGITELKNGVSFIMIPAVKSTTTLPTINVNGLGEKNIKRRLSGIYTSLQSGYSDSWLAANIPFRLVYDATSRSTSTNTGVWVVEGVTKPSASDLYGVAPQAKADADGNIFTDTYATLTALQNMLPKVTSITLASVWGGSTAPYYQDIDLSCCTETSIVDLQPTPDQGWAFTTQSGAGVVRVYVAGGCPSEAITIQVKVQEVVVI